MEGGHQVEQSSPKTVEVGSSTWSPGSEKVGDCAGSAVGVTSVDSSWVAFCQVEDSVSLGRMVNIGWGGCLSKVPTWWTCVCVSKVITWWTSAGGESR